MDYLPFRRRRPRLAGGALAGFVGARVAGLGGGAGATPIAASASRLIAWLTGCLGCDADDRLTGVGRVRDLARRSGSPAAIVMSERALDLVRGQPDLVVGPVEDQVATWLREVEQVERLDGDLDVLQRRHVERGDQQQLVGLVERLEDVLVEGRARCRRRRSRSSASAAPGSGRPATAGSSPWRRAAPARPASESPAVRGEQRLEDREVQAALEVRPRRRWCGPGTAAG